METKIESPLDCEWHITNLIIPNSDPTYNKTLCEEYFSSLSQDKQSQTTTEEFASTTEEPNGTQIGTETPQFHDTTFSFLQSFDSLEDGQGTTTFNESTRATQDYFTETVTDSDVTLFTASLDVENDPDFFERFFETTVSSPDFTEQISLESFDGNYTSSTFSPQTIFDSDSTTIAQQTTSDFRDLLNRTVTVEEDMVTFSTREFDELRLSDEEEFDYFSGINFESTTFSSGIQSSIFQTETSTDMFSGMEITDGLETTLNTHTTDTETTTELLSGMSVTEALEELGATHTSDLYESTPFYKTFKEMEKIEPKISTETVRGVAEFINKAMTTEVGTTEMELSSKKLLNLSEPAQMKLNDSLCEWYLPTVEQTPIALGSAGIALWVLGFIITFILVFLFAKQAYFIYRTAHKSFRRHLYSITSVYVVIAILTSIGSGIPRAHAVCSGVKDVYMAIGIGHFVDLTISMYGGENVMYWYLKDKTISVKSIFFCRCFFCIPRCKVKRSSVTILKWVVWQMKWSQALYYILKLIWVKAMENTMGVVMKHEIPFWSLHVLNLVSFLSGVVALLVIGDLVTDDLQDKYNYSIKAKLVRFTILTTKFQRLLFEILEACNVFPCYPPYVSMKFSKNVLKDFVYLVEVVIIGVLTFIAYMKRGEFEHANSNEVPKQLIEKGIGEQPPTEENGDVDLELTIPLNRNESNPETSC